MANVGPETSTTSAVPEIFTSTASQRATPLQRRTSFLSTAVVAVIVPGLFATVALPAYAYTEPVSVAKPATTSLTGKTSHAQSVAVDSSASATVAVRDTFGATSPEEAERAALAATYASYTGPTAADYLANPPYPNFDLAAVAAVAQQYVGSPYVFGGATPAGFDCSGFVMFVYSQFGIALPHSVSGQAAMGTPIAVADALPGDIVILPGHDGIYLGGGMFIDAPDYGEVVHVRPIYDSNYYIVRIGI